MRESESWRADRVVGLTQASATGNTTKRFTYICFCMSYAGRFYVKLNFFLFFQPLLFFLNPIETNRSLLGQLEGAEAHSTKAVQPTQAYLRSSLGSHVKIQMNQRICMVIIKKLAIVASDRPVPEFTR
jgi:hypothetical protein